MTPLLTTEELPECDDLLDEIDAALTHPRSCTRLERLMLLIAEILRREPDYWDRCGGLDEASTKLDDAIDEECHG